MKRTFIIGSEWLYFKIYTGPKTSDRVLTEVIKPISEILLKENVIDSWFFIRYSDPKLHIRVRFHHTTSLEIDKTIKMMYESLYPFVENDIVWKVAIDTYSREIERYGKEQIELAEQLFYEDSVMAVDILDKIEGDDGEEIRWLIALKAVDDMLSVFNYNDENKLKYIENLRDSFWEEFGKDKDLKAQIHDKYRKNKDFICNVMRLDDDPDNEMKVLANILQCKRNKIKSISNTIIELEEKGGLEISKNLLMNSYLHMMCNRLFKTKQRLFELVLYCFLRQYYSSLIVRNK